MSLPLLRHSRIVAAAGLLALVAACGGKVDHGPVRVDVIGTREQMREPLDNGNSAAGQVMLSATAQGLVAFNASGELIGGLAERWIVEDDGQSYLFRLKQARWRDGTPVRANEVARLLRARLKAHPAIVAGLNPDVRGMTDEVLEIRLPGATPSFLQLLAHPAMAIARPGGGTGPFTLKTRGGLATLTPHAPARAEGDREDDSIRRAMPIFVRVTRPALAFARFDKEQSDLVLGGRFQHLPYVALAVPPKGAVRADPVDGLLGLAIEGRSDFLADSTVREILSMAIDRGQIATRLNLAGWRTATTILPDQLDLGRAPTAADWSTRDLALRQSYARSVVDNWTKLHAAPPTLRIALPDGPGARMLFRAISQDYAAIGLSVVLVPWDAPADLRLIDEVAPFDSALWYLARLGCDLNRLCSKEGEAKLTAAREARSEADRSRTLGEAETLILAAANYIPLGMPIRFSLVRPRLTGYALSPRARHPLNALFRDTR